LSAFDLNGKCFNVTETAAAGVVDQETEFRFRQDDNIVTASYAGGQIRQGYLVGKLDGAALHFRYCQIQIDGRIDGGESHCTIERQDGGRLRIVERFEWASRPGETGVNVFEELPG